MQQGTRGCVAYVAGRVVSGTEGTSIFDYSRSKHVSFGGSIDGDSVSVYDYERKCHFSGSLPSLYDYGTQAHVLINIKADSSDGYDYKSQKHFSGSVSGSSVSLYDYEESKHFSYTL